MEFKIFHYLSSDQWFTQKVKVWFSDSKLDYMELAEFVNSFFKDDSASTYREILNRILFTEVTEDNKQVGTNVYHTLVNFNGSGSSALAGITVNLLSMLRSLISYVATMEKQHNLQIASLKEEQAHEIAALKESHNHDVSVMNLNMKEQIADLEAQNDKISENIAHLHVNALKMYRHDIEKEYAALIKEYETKFADVHAACDERIANVISDKDAVIDDLKSKLKRQDRLVSLLIKKHDMFIENQKRAQAYDTLESDILSLMNEDFLSD